MEARQFQGKTLKYLTIEPDGFDADASYPMIILLHGFGASMNDLAGLCPAIHREGYVYICPNAPLPVEVGPGMVDYAWAPRGGAIAGASDYARAEEMIATLVEEVMEQYHIEPGQAIMGGFSQGGAMTYRVGLPRPELFSGLAALSAVAPDPDLIRQQLPTERTLPIFVAHGTVDEILSIDGARKTRDFLEAEGYKPEYREYRMGHQITQELLDDLVPWIHKVLPPRKGPGARD